jgi:hypothetical protein
MKRKERRKKDRKKKGRKDGKKECEISRNEEAGKK